MQKLDDLLDQDLQDDASNRPKTAPTKNEQEDPLPNQDLEPIAHQTPEPNRVTKLVAKNIENKIA